MLYTAVGLVHSHDIDDDPHAPYISAWGNRLLLEYLRGQVLVVYTGLQLSSEGLLAVMSGSTKVYQLEQVSAPRDLNHHVTGLCVCVGGGGGGGDTLKGEMKIKSISVRKKLYTVCRCVWVWLTRTSMWTMVRVCK